jgi:hypothetical protein
MTQKSKRTAPRKLAPDQLAKREAIFGVYRDMDPPRSYERLMRMVEPKYGKISKRTLVYWSAQHHWQARVADYDDTLAVGSEVQADLDPNFDAAEALARSAHLALQRALASHPVVRTPQDYKALVDSAEKALLCIEKLRELGVGRSKPAELQGIVNRAARLFQMVDEATRAKFAAMGTPVKDHVGPIIDAVATEVSYGPPELPAPIETPMVEADI